MISRIIWIIALSCTGFLSNGPAASAQFDKDVIARPGAPVFEVVSVRASAPHYDRRTEDINPDGISLTGYSLRALIHLAYGVKSDLIEGGARWTYDSIFDCYAKVGANDIDTFGSMTRGQRRAMLQGVLAEKFRLRTHTEKKMVAVYRLSVAADGHRNQQSLRSKDASGKPSPDVPESVNIGPSEFNGNQVSMATLIKYLEPILQFSIIDDTGLTGRYDIDLKWSIDGASGIADQSSAIAAALRDQGFKLTPGKWPVDELVIDEAALPTEN